MYVTSELWLCGFGILVAILLRCGTFLHPYSGQNQPPMFGDYEAQRHWMEITVNLPLKQWYHNTTENDLMYWGLDYPPLTAYHSYICGLIASSINNDYVALFKSRGYESEEHKLFMRYTVLFVDLVLYIPSVVLYFTLFTKLYPKCTSNISAPFAIILALFYPGIILIDHGHFQYNCVSLAFAIFAITFICIHKHVLASVFFCLALNYKQMELYHSLPFFVYLLSACVPKPGQSMFSGIKKFLKLAITVLTVFGIIWAPFLTDVKNTRQVLHRLFPVARGVFEDKVANFWCALNVFYKLKASASNEQIFQYCIIATLVAVLPTIIDLFLRPNVHKFVPALINSSLAFFLFSFQVHEKSILLVAVPVMLYIQRDPVPVLWFLIISLFSMFPLIVKDELTIAFISLTTFYCVIIYSIIKYKPALIPQYQTILSSIFSIRNSKNRRTLLLNLRKNMGNFCTLFKSLMICFSLVGCVLLILSMLMLKPPQNYPDIYPLLISVYSCIHFLGFFVYFNVVQFKIPQAIEDIKHIKLENF